MSQIYAGLALAASRTYALDPKYFVDDRASQDETLKLVGQLGYNFNEYIAIEGRIGGSIYSEDSYAGEAIKHKKV